MLYGELRKVVGRIWSVRGEVENRVKGIKEGGSGSRVRVNGFFCEFEGIGVLFDVGILGSEKFKKDVRVWFVVISEGKRRISEIR